MRREDDHFMYKHKDLKRYKLMAYIFLNKATFHVFIANCIRRLLIPLALMKSNLTQKMNKDHTSSNQAAVLARILARSADLKDLDALNVAN